MGELTGARYSPLQPSDREPKFGRLLSFWHTTALVLPALLAVAAIRYSLSPWLGDRPVLVFFFVPILLGAYHGGFVGGMAATLASAVLTYLWFLPNGMAFSELRVVDAIQWGIFVACGAMISAICQRLHNFRRETEKSLTGRLQAEETLRRSDAYLKLVIDNMAEGVVISDDKGHLLHWNQSALEAHGLGPDGEWCLHYHDFTKIFELAELNGKVIPVEEWPLARILRGETISRWAIRIRRVDRDWSAVFEYGGALIRDVTGQPFAFVTIVDATARIRASDALTSMNQELERRVHERTREMEFTIKELEAFTYSVSHDLRAPLRAIDGFSELALEDYGEQLPEEGRHYLETIRGSAHRMRNLIEDLLAFSRIRRASINRLEVDTSMLVRQVVNECLAGRHEPLPNIVAEPLPNCHADHALLKQVWSNLIENAIKYSSKRADAVIEIGSREIDGECVYYVKDNGIGFDVAYIDKIFEVFQRLHRSDEYEGTGVGLAVVHRVVHRHGGRVWAESEVGKGSTFFFTLGQESTEVPLERS